MSAFAFAFPAVLTALVLLPVIWWLLRLTPPKPLAEIFPPFAILASVMKREETPAQSPWWLTLLRMLMAAAIIFAIADPVFNPRTNTLAGSGPLALVIDNSWASATDWQRRVETASALIDDAESRDVPIALLLTADRQHDAVPVDAATARNRLAAAEPRPLPTERNAAVASLATALGGTPPGTLAFISDGMAAGETDETVTALQALSPAEFRLIEGDGQDTIAITGATNGADALSLTLTRLGGGPARSLPLTAHDSRGRPIAAGTANFAAGATTATGTITAPFELRNDFARVSVDGVANAGGTYLLDDGFRRRRVAFLSGEVVDASQPLLSPLHYINRALAPYADLVEPSVADLSVAIPELLEQNPSVMIMADIGRLPEDVQGAVRRWIEAGGMLIRFAGPRLAAAPADDPLVPVLLRKGERALGGALSWSEPQPLAAYPANSPFFGMRPPEQIFIKRQVLAEPTPDLAERTWAGLADGTPLVTTGPLGSGRLVLFHVSAETGWSNLPLSGDFVEMLRRTVQLSRGGGVSASVGAETQGLPPYRLMTANGTLAAATGEAKPLANTAGTRKAIASFDNPPGLYGTEDGYVAHNLFPPGHEIRPLPVTQGAALLREPLAGRETWSLKPHLFTLAALLLIADCAIVLLMGGAFAAAARRMPARNAAAAVLLALFAAALVAAPTESRAQETRPGDETILSRLDTTHLAYVVTGEGEVDRISERGLTGLTDFMTYRTTLEPGQPVGVDIAKDELSLYPIIYWPVSATAAMPSGAAISRIDAYMRNGGTVLFDTRDQFVSLDGNSTSPNTERLQAILANLDIPPLEPVPADHVLTKAFYLLANFPGRYAGSPLWVEAELDRAEDPTRPARAGDGVSPIMITGNDFAGAWAVDANGMALLPTVPPDEVQRDHAFRSGVNIMMYMLTGNYKADQVHVPALLERLGQ